MKNIFLFLLTFISLQTYSQETIFKHYKVDNGLSQSVVKCIYQDSEGFLWIGTQDGLNKFDGYGFLNLVHNTNNRNSISDNWIYDIKEDKNKNIWIATRNGLNKFNKKSGHFNKFFNIKGDENSLFNNIVCGLTIDKNKNIVVNTPPYINIYKENKFERINTGLQYDGSVPDENLPIITDKKGNIWIASTTGLAVYNSHKKEIKTYTKESNKIITDNHITTLFEDKKENIWIGTKKGLIIYKSEINSFEKLNPKLKNNFIRTIFQDDFRNIWIGTNGGGLTKLILQKNGNYKVITYQNDKNNNNSISHNIVLSLLQDKSKVLWVGTLNGIDKVDLKKKKFQIYRSSKDFNLSDNVIASLFKENENKIWIGTWGNGLNVLDKNTNKVVLYSTNQKGNRKISNNFIHVIHKDTHENIWIGTRDGIDIYDKKTQGFVGLTDFFKTKNIPDFRNIRIYHITNDEKGNTWIATQNGLYKINIEKDSFQIFTEENSKISGNLIYQILLDSKENLWFATTKGLDKYNLKNKTFKHYKNNPNDKNSLCDNFVVTLCEDKYHNIWIGTKSGIDKLNPENKNFTHFCKKDGLTNYVIYEILEDDNNDIWIASGDGLFKYDIRQKYFETFKIEDGLQSMEFNTACFRADDGELFFGGMNGVNYFYPSTIRKNDYIPPIVITTIEKTNDSGKIRDFNIFEKKKIHLSYLDYDLMIKFASLDYTNLSKNLYAYKMTGVSKKWIDIQNRNFVNFPQLSAGEYIFQVKGSNNDGIWNEKGKTLKIIIYPPWWKTKIAYFSYGLVLILSTILFVKYREKKLLQEKLSLEIKVAERTEEITQQKNIIEESHKQVTSSINYASLIQNAMLPSHAVFKKYFSEYFVLNKPRDIVSGDFYYLARVNENIIFAVADCTGHGVPGAFVSMLGISFLNEIIRKKEITKASEVLDALRNLIKISLKQDDNKTKDGMDIAFCVYNKKTSILQYSGAYNPAYIYRNSELIELKGNRQPIGIYIKEKPFVNHTFQLQKNDIIYLFSDGYVDQFGGEDDRQFTKRRFKNMIAENLNKSLFEQEKVFENTFKNWKGNKDQIDDVLVMAVKI